MLQITYTLVGFIGMEAASWAIHKYLMHGPLWFIHKTHHTKQKSFLELNDVFSLFFGTIACLCMYVGFGQQTPLFFIGLGISLYGFLYFILHDWLIHRRIKLKGKLAGYYLSAVWRAHRAHHKSPERDHAESFGLLFVHKKFFDQHNNSIKQ